MICNTCGETMSGDGYKTALHCPNVDASDREPDATPLHCTGAESDCGNCFEGKSDLDHTCRECGGAGQAKA